MILFTQDPTETYKEFKDETNEDRFDELLETLPEEQQEIILAYVHELIKKIIK